MVVNSPSHDMVSLDVEFEHWDLQKIAVNFHAFAAKEVGRRRGLTPL